jgi:hypothetical protein
VWDQKGLNILFLVFCFIKLARVEDAHVRSEGNRPLARPTMRQEDDIKMEGWA